MTLNTPFGKISAATRAEHQRRQRRLLRRLEHHRVAGGQRRRELPRRHHQRIVPWRDRADDADRIAANHAGVTGQIFVGDRAADAARRAGEEAEAVGDGRNLVAECARKRLAAVERSRAGRTPRRAPRSRPPASAASASAPSASFRSSRRTPGAPRRAALFTCSSDASRTPTMRSPVAGFSTCSSSPSPRTNVPSISSSVAYFATVVFGSHRGPPG